MYKNSAMYKSSVIIIMSNESIKNINTGLISRSVLKSIINKIESLGFYLINDRAILAKSGSMVFMPTRENKRKFIAIEIKYEYVGMKGFTKSILDNIGNCIQARKDER